MSKAASLSSKKSQQLLQSLRDQQRHSLGTEFESANILLLPKYHLRDKDLRKIHKAALVGNAARVQELLLGKRDSDFTPFLLAVSESKLKMAKFLLMKNANIHAIDSQKRTALMHAVSHDSTNLVRFVLQQGVDFFSTDAFGLTAMDYAAGFKNDI